MQLASERAHDALVHDRSLEQRDRRVPAGWKAAKRLTDITLGSLCLIVAAPIVLASALAIVAVTGGAPFYAQERVGRGGRRFRMLKLRTMVKDAHSMREDLLHLNEADGPVFKIRNDPRLHPLGGLLRRTSIDELPNLFNVLR
ncbi:MAG: sugar transferase, partial [Vulcanimicrobiaceae bacterium]